MSYDLSIQGICDHRMFRERAELASDRRSLRVSKLIATTANVVVYAADNLVPKSMYGFIYDPLMVAQAQERMVFFHKKWKSTEDYFEVCYNTMVNTCPKCVGLKTLDDIHFDARGELATLRNEELLLQNLEKFTVTAKGSNPFHRWLGTTLIQLLGTKLTDMDFMTTRVTQEINATLSALQDLQQQYIQAGRFMTTGEQLDKIVEIKVKRGTEDPTIVRADIAVRAKSGKTVTYSQYMRMPS